MYWKIFPFPKINIANYYLEQKIWICCLLLWAGTLIFLPKIEIWSIFLRSENLPVGNRINTAMQSRYLNWSINYPVLTRNIKDLQQCTEVHFASIFSGGFITPRHPPRVKNPGGGAGSTGWGYVMCPPWLK